MKSVQRLATRARRAGLVAGLASALWVAGTAHAADAVDTETPTVRQGAEFDHPPPLIPPEAERLDERTAYTIGRHTFKIGLLALDFGITEKLSVGTDPPAWAARALGKIWIPNLHVKYQFYNRGRWAVAGTAGFYYASISGSDGSGQVLDIPFAAFASFIAHPHVILHFEGSYVFARMLGAGDVQSSTVHGAAAARAVQLGLMGQFPVTHIFSLIALGRVQVYTGDVGFNATSQVDPYTSVTLNGNVVPKDPHPWQAVVGAAFLWKHFHLQGGVGYGSYFVPGLYVPVPKTTVVPDISLSVLL
jgi:hypothetical protein